MTTAESNEMTVDAAGDVEFQKICSKGTSTSCPSTLARCVYIVGIV
jgi:hypothetical protein